MNEEYVLKEKLSQQPGDEPVERRPKRRTRPQI